MLVLAGTGKKCTLSMRVPNPSPVLDKNRAPTGPEMLSSTWAGVWRRAPKAFPDSSSVLEKLQSAKFHAPKTEVEQLELFFFGGSKPGT